MVNDTYKQGTKISFNNGVVVGTGTICGIATSGVPVLGRGYIIKIDHMMYTTGGEVERSYDCFSTTENFITPN